jgi:TorA maturation chaperone TorD
MTTHELSDLTRAIGGIVLDGARADLHDTVRSTGMLRDLAAAATPFAAALTALHDALQATTAIAVAQDFTRLTIVNAVDGKRRPVPAPLYEDCYQGGPREVMGDRHRAVVRAFAGAGLGFDGMEASPVDHVGLELTFVAQLLEEELEGRRGPEVRHAFVREHLRPLATRFGANLVEASQERFWQVLGRLLPEVVDQLADPADLVHPAVFHHHRSSPSHLPVIS